VRVLKRSWFEEEIPVQSAACDSLKQWTIMPLSHGTRVRANELRLLKVSDIESEQMVLHIGEGKAQVPRNTGSSQALLERLRIYWSWRKPKDSLFPPAAARPAHG
jgi:integrase